MDFYWHILPLRAIVLALIYCKEWLSRNRYLLQYYWWRSGFANRSRTVQLIFAELFAYGLLMTLHLVTSADPYFFDAHVPHTLVTLGCLYISIFLTSVAILASLCNNIIELLYDGWEFIGLFSKNHR